MNCRQFRDALDCYVDGELSVTAAGIADAHRRRCPACDRAAYDLQTLKRRVRDTVLAIDPPEDLASDIGWTLAQAGAEGGRPWHRRVAVRAAMAAAAILMLAGASVGTGRLQANAADTMDQMALMLNDSGPVEFQGTVLCRDCELERRFGVTVSCPRAGHRGAIATADGLIWNIVEQPASERLIHDAGVLGRAVRVRGRIFRSARTLVVDSYAFLP